MLTAVCNVCIFTNTFAITTYCIKKLRRQQAFPTPFFKRVSAFQGGRTGRVTGLIGLSLGWFFYLLYLYIYILFLEENTNEHSSVLICHWIFSTWWIRKILIDIHQLGNKPYLKQNYSWLLTWFINTHNRGMNCGSVVLIKLPVLFKQEKYLLL